MRTPSAVARVALTGALCAAAWSAGAQPAPASPGELLYQKHCVACHDKQVHWRAKRIVSDWATLAAEVRRWQANLGLGWSDGTVREVTRYLNDAIYHFPAPADRQIG
ncbi:MAG: cytochrome C [Burkholderiales bacterium]